ncbi:MAG: mechanosensitive ion channel domain-containing protein [Pseudomonadota bacterium]
MLRFAVIALAAVVLAASATAQQSGGATSFQVQALNQGLPSAPDRLDRSTPRATTEAFVTFAGRGDFTAAAHLLDLDAIPIGEQAALGPQRAEELAFLLRRKLPIDFAALPDRPDGMDTSGADREPMVGVPRKSIVIGTLDLQEWPVTIRLNRLQVGDSGPVWLFSRQSVEHIAPLFARYGPTAFEKALPDPLRSTAFLGLLWWELIALPMVLIIAGSLAFVAWQVMGIVGRNSPFKSVGVGLRRSRLPVAILITGIVLQIANTTVFEFSAATDATLSLIFWILIIVAVVAGVARVLDTVIDFASNRYLETIDDPANTSAREWYTNLSAAKRIGVMMAIVIGAAAAFSSLDLFSSFGLSLLISAGVATAIFGLAAQAILGNIFASLQLAIAKPIRIGDAVYYDGTWAYVERINYTYVQLRTWDMKRFIVPVKHFVSNPFENWTKAEPKMIKAVLLKLDHRTDVEALRTAFKEIAQNDPDWSEGEEPKVQVIDHDDEAMHVRFYIYADDPTSAWNLHCRVREKLLAHLRTKNEPSAFPRTRLAVVSNAPEEDASGSYGYQTGERETGEPKAAERRDPKPDQHRDEEQAGRQHAAE